MTFNWLDYSYGRPAPAAMVNAGVLGVSRYLWSRGKGIDAAELATLHKDKLGVSFGYEALAGNALLGAAQGKIDGQHAVAFAKALGVPKGTWIYYAADRQVLTASGMDAVVAYLHAADDPDYPSSVYGQKSVVDRWYAESKRTGWQTVAWSDGEISEHASLYQFEINQIFDGAAVDYNTVQKLDKLSVWWPEPRYEDGEMADGLSPTAQDQIRAIVRGEINKGAPGPHGRLRKFWRIAANALHPGRPPAPGKK